MTMRDFIAALELLDECRAALSIDADDAAAEMFSSMCEQARRLSSQIDAFLESVDYSNQPRLKDLAPEVTA